MARSFEPLARRVCKAVYDLADGSLSKSIPVDVVAAEVNVSNAELIRGAIAHARQEGWLTTSGVPVHSLLLTGSGGQIAAKAKWRPGTTARMAGLETRPGRAKQNSRKPRST